MESPSIHGGAEENSSCESGWTTYIEDTFHSHVVVYDDDDDDNDQSDERDLCDDGDDNDEEGDDDSSEDDGDEESDDSMASDASSWPSNKTGPETKLGPAMSSSRLLKNTTKHAVKQVEEADQSEHNAKTRNTAKPSKTLSRGKVNKTK